MNEEDLRKTVESLIRGEIQDVINDYVDDQEKSSSGGGFGRSRNIVTLFSS